MGVSRPTVTRSKQCGRKVPPTGTSARSAVLPRSRSAVPRRARLKARFDDKLFININKQSSASIAIFD